MITLDNIKKENGFVVGQGHNKYESDIKDDEIGKLVNARKNLTK